MYTENHHYQIDGSPDFYDHLLLAVVKKKALLEESLPGGACKYGLLDEA
jgi:hypothetical protein